MPAPHAPPPEVARDRPARAELVWALVAAALVLAPNLAALSEWSYDWDAAQLALGTRDFDLAGHRPHPPGYPLWVGAVRVCDAAVGNVPRTQLLLGSATTGLALAAFARLLRPRR
ncbi:hypothetical protein KDM41_16390, partial [bacterium]|nr:hypothetical protein [bacterium]